MIENIHTALFDGYQLFDNVIVSIHDGQITDIKENKDHSLPDLFMMPCLIDAHTHMKTIDHVHQLLKYGIHTTFDVCASSLLINQSKDLKIISSLDMIMGFVLNPHQYVKKEVEKGAKYIKILLFNSFTISLTTLKEIVKETHQYHLKVVVHATSMSTYLLAINAHVDIILHLPMKDELTDELAKTIANNHICVVPTLNMMQTFAYNQKNGYKKEHFENALKQVENLHRNGVTLLVGTDANDGHFAPHMSYGDSIYQEIHLLLKANVPLLDVLKASTSNIGKAYDMDLGTIEVGKKANFLLFKKDKSIEIDANHLQTIWINGKKRK